VAKYLTTTELIASVIRRAMLPVTQTTFVEEDFLAFANEEMNLGIVPHIISFHENYLLAEYDVDIVDNQTRYEIPHRAVGNKLKDVQFIDQSGRAYEMTQIEVGDLPYHQWGSNKAINGTLNSFYLEGNELVTTNASFTGKLRFLYYLRPSDIVPIDRSAKITNIDTVNKVVTLNSSPSVFVGQVLFDITATRSPFKAIGLDMSGTFNGSSTNPQITFTSDLPTHLKVGDIVTLTEETIIPQIPLELHSMLAQRVALRCLDAMGDANGIQTGTARLAEMEQKTGTLLDNRVEDAPHKISPKNSFLRRKRTYLRR
jgi:hypothetical protein